MCNWNCANSEITVVNVSTNLHLPVFPEVCMIRTSRWCLGSWIIRGNSTEGGKQSTQSTQSKGTLSICVKTIRDIHGVAIRNKTTHLSPQGFFSRIIDWHLVGNWLTLLTQYHWGSAIKGNIECLGNNDFLVLLPLFKNFLKKFFS